MKCNSLWCFFFKKKFKFFIESPDVIRAAAGDDPTPFRWNDLPHAQWFSSSSPSLSLTLASPAYSLISIFFPTEHAGRRVTATATQSISKSTFPLVHLFLFLLQAPNVAVLLSHSFGVLVCASVCTRTCTIIFDYGVMEYSRSMLYGNRNNNITQVFLEYFRTVW